MPFGVHRAALERVRYVVNSRESPLWVELESLEISFGTKPPLTTLNPVLER